MSAFRHLLSKYYHKFLNIRDGVSCYLNDMSYFIKESNLSSNNSKEASLRSSLTASYHIIEKGLSMPSRRLGFGRDRLLSLIYECETYYEKYGKHSQLSYAIALVREYDQLHKTENYILDGELQRKIDKLLARFPEVGNAEQLTFTKQQYFSNTNKQFDAFSSSRHSVRHFQGNIPLELVAKAIELAKNAPSACNKQPVRIHVISNKQTVSEVLEMQQGNRGFGQHIDKVLIVTTQYTGCTRFSEREMPFMDAGIFTMNLLYSLHFYQIGAIPLVWLSSKTRDRGLRYLANIPMEEKPAILIGIGDVANSIVCPQSPRLPLNEIMIVK